MTPCADCLTPIACGFNGYCGNVNAKLFDALLGYNDFSNEASIARMTSPPAPVMPQSRGDNPEGSVRMKLENGAGGTMKHLPEYQILADKEGFYIAMGDDGYDVCRTHRHSSFLEAEDEMKNFMLEDIETAEQEERDMETMAQLNEITR